MLQNWIVTHELANEKYEVIGVRVEIDGDDKREKREHKILRIEDARRLIALKILPDYDLTGEFPLLSPDGYDDFYDFSELFDIDEIEFGNLEWVVDREVIDVKDRKTLSGYVIIRIRKKRKNLLIIRLKHAKKLIEKGKLTIPKHIKDPLYLHVDDDYTFNSIKGL